MVTMMMITWYELEFFLFLIFMMYLPLLVSFRIEFLCSFYQTLVRLCACRQDSYQHNKLKGKGEGGKQSLL